MHRLLVVLALGAMLALTACQEPAPKTEAPKAAAPKVEAPANTTAAPAAPAAKAMALAVVDENRLYEESTLGMAANTILKATNAKLQAELRDFQEAKKDNATEAEAEEFRKAVQVYQDIMRTAQTQLFETIRGRVTEALSNYRQQHGLELVLSKENVLAYGSQADITEAVLQALNAMPADDLKGPELKDGHNLFGATAPAAQ